MTQRMSIMTRWQFLARFFDHHCSVQLGRKGDAIVLHLMLTQPIADMHTPYPYLRG